MKQLLLATAFLFTTLTHAQEIVSKPLTIGEIKTIHSAILKEDRVLNIYIPHAYDKTKSYPVLYVLDGSMNEDFLHITGLVQFFNLMFNMPDFIIVGIANVDRKRDFTFHTDLKDLKKNYPTTGYSQAFIKFIAEELQPYINKTYATNNTRYFIGQSLGGLLATEILLKNTSLFTHYFIVSPSLWWDNESMLKQAPELLAQQPDSDLYVYVSVGKNEDKIMVREAEAIYSVLKKSGRKNLKADYKLMENDNHATILHRSIYEGFLKLYPYKE